MNFYLIAKDFTGLHMDKSLKLLAFTWYIQMQQATIVVKIVI